MSINLQSPNRKQLIILGLILTIVVLGVFVLLLNRPGKQTDPNFGISQTDVSELAYCNEKQVKPCVVSFGLDVDNNMLVNILLPDLSFPVFYLEIIRGEINVSYSCKRITATPNNAYCIGEKLPPGESLHLMLLSTKDDVLLAQGNLSIIGLAFPTLEIAIPTDVPVTPGSIGTPDFILSTSTQVQLSTRTPPAYPNPSYP